ncbi:ASKHA domain-containing protein [Candidatus Njordibacter sp. Uisw_056]|uniref:ASKHA domain-containing protein n=1 Tax=Candidatus Njordibacter sp. Uisw_056 TaxID=3230973 RepID=UPI003D4CB7FB
MSQTNTDDALVVFTPSGKRGRFPVGTPLLQAARYLNVDIDSVCGARGICGRCQIFVSEGEFAKFGITSTADSLEPITAPELKFAERRGLKPGRRLSCHTKVLNDIVVDVPAESQVHHQMVRKDAEHHDIDINPLVRLYYVEVQEPDMHDPSGDLRRLLNALEADWQLLNLSYDVALLATIQPILRAGNWGVTVAVRQGEQIVALWPGLKDRIFGVAVDVGSTTIAAHLCNLSSGEVVASSGVMNPQIRFGEDLMSRVSYVMMNPGGEVDMTNAVREAINGLVTDLVKQVECEAADLLEITFVANPIMHHLLLGINPIELGGAPFALATDMAVNILARDMGVNLNPQARAYLLPCIAGHVGADTAGMVLAEEPYNHDEMTLLVDVGTNAEIVLGNRHRLVACSSPTGPAFEGAQISCGQRAAAGAIERIRIDSVTLEPRFQVISCELWSDEKGFDTAIEKTGITGICGSGIIEVVAEMYLAGVITQDGVIDGSLAATNPRIQPDGRTFSYEIMPSTETRGAVKIMQNDIRAIQLAKAALYAGVKLLMQYQQVDKVDRIRFAGAFGSHIDVKYAMVLGLIPDCALNEVSSAGNAAGTGARIALLNEASRAEIEQVVRSIEKIETAVEPDFQQLFIDAMAFPNKVDAFPELEKVVTLPPLKEASAESENGDKKRRRRRG